MLKTHLGPLSLSLLEEPDEVNRFKTHSDYAEDVELTSIHRVLERLRAAINWGMAQTPPLLGKSPFHRIGVRLNKKAEVSRGRSAKARVRHEGACRLPADGADIRIMFRERRLAPRASPRAGAPRPGKLDSHQVVRRTSHR